MSDKKNSNDKNTIKTKDGNSTDFPGYPAYPASDDIYNHSSEAKNIELEDLSKIKDIENNEIVGFDNGKELDDKQYGDDLDVPGSELDDDDEKVGNEDEENNYYSIGGDEHNDLTENQGD